MPYTHTERKFRLGAWLSAQRRKKDSMPVGRTKRLDAIGIIWDPLESDWEEAIAALKKYKARKGHCRVPFGHTEKKFKLGRWVGHQRKIKDAMPDEHRQRLDKIGFVWDPLERVWEEGFAALKKFKAREGNCLVPAAHTEGTTKLGVWVNQQRQSRDTMPAERKNRLESIGFIWNARENKWENAFVALKKFKAREGHSLVPIRHVEGTIKLGLWINSERYRRNTMPIERIKRLNAIGFAWNALNNRWHEAFARLKKFKAREGHCLVPVRYVEGTVKLGSWVAHQRKIKDTMPPAHRKSLELIGFVWDPFTIDWESGFSALKKFKAREGHCLVPATYVEENFKLGTWVRNQRRHRDTISTKRKRRLDTIGFFWDPRESAWKRFFTALTKFKKREGHCRVPYAHVEKGLNLGVRVSELRSQKGSMPVERRKQLDAIGFVWRVNMK